MYPDSPYLLPAFYDNPKQQLGDAKFKELNITEWVSKPLFGREGLGVFFSKNFTNFDAFAK